MAERLRFTKSKPFTSGDMLRLIFRNLTTVQMKEVFCVILAVTRNLPRQQGEIEKAILALLTDTIPTAKVISTLFGILDFARKKGEFQLTEKD